MKDVALDERGLPAGYPLNDGYELTPRQVRDMRQQGEDFLLIDCRTSAEAEVAVIDDSHLIPLQTLPHCLDTLEPYRDQKVVVYCHAGMRSLQAAAWLRQQGFVDVWSMAGGIELWSLDIDPSVPRY